MITAFYKQVNTTPAWDRLDTLPKQGGMIYSPFLGPRTTVDWGVDRCIRTYPAKRRVGTRRPWGLRSDCETIRDGKE